MKTNLDWNKLKLFYYVAKGGSFTATAERLNMSQSSLSRSIHDLEYQLDAKLFQRLSRGVILTKHGTFLFKVVERAFEEFSQANNLIKEDERELQGVLKVGIPINILPGWFVSHIGGFLEHYPSIQLYLRRDEGRNDLRIGQVDVCLSSFLEKRTDAVQELIHIFKINLYASSEYLQKYGIPKKQQDLSSHRLIVYDLDTSVLYPNIHWLLKLGMPKGSIRNPYMCVNSLSGMLQAAENGIGIVALPIEYKDFSKKKLIEVLPDIKKPDIPLYYIYPEHLKESQRIKVFGNYLKNRFSPLEKENESDRPTKLMFK
jgi:DNA-binding transcriptional LysR family regulator